ncbi:hypothetical protein GJV85_12480 [Sulfurimonas aquatica]|uniref:Lipoprotein n=1 Tax=Sulfurimonas aquatica TaxID=2672570 RepID=A0A975B278_9BACT|nr:hypothetical protein [Sulfurimonas aquatica]QSZ42889.1 hypothetical protein GJV85_12480 [Sulfurimonas aquatica]
MKTLINMLIITGITLFMSGCFAEKSYLGKVDVIGVGAGAKPVNPDMNHVEKAMLPNIMVATTPELQVQEQDVHTNVKYVLGDTLTKEYSGEPKMLADYLNAYSVLLNKVYIIDKNGVVAWSGSFKDNDIENAQGVYDYGLTGADRISFDEAMEKFVLDGDEADFDDDKVVEFPKDNTDSFLSGFSYSKKYPMLLTKFPDMEVLNSHGDKVSMSSLSNNGKPTVVVLYMSKAPDSSMFADVSRIQSMFTGESNSRVSPQKVLQRIEEVYFSTK